MFWQVCWSNYDWKKGTVLWPLVGMFGGSMSSDCFGGFLDQITTRKKSYSRLAIGCNVWGVPWARINLAGLLLCFLAGSSIKLQIMTGKKVQSSGHRLECLLRTFDLLHPRVDRPSAMTPWGIYPGRKLPALTWGLLVPSARRGFRKDTMIDGWRPRRCRPSLWWPHPSPPPKNVEQLIQ